MKITHHYYVVPGIVDGRKCHEDADRRRRDKRDPGDSIVHEHEKGARCNNRCTTYLVGGNKNV
jgi:hypothetical protein